MNAMQMVGWAAAIADTARDLDDEELALEAVDDISFILNRCGDEESQRRFDRWMERADEAG